MAQIIHDTSQPNDGLGDELRTAFNNQNAMNTELYQTKVDEVAGKGLSENDFTNADKEKLDSLNNDGEANVQANWNETDPSSPAYIIGKPMFEQSYISANAVWTGNGLKFSVTADAFPVSGITYAAIPGEVELDSADPLLDRIDLIVAIRPIAPMTVGSVGKITGEPASSALVFAPDYDPTYYYVIKQITVKAGASQPEGVANTKVFDEGVEWAVTLTPNLEITPNSPKTGAFSIEATANNTSDSATFTSPTPVSADDLDLLTFWLKLKAPVLGKSMYVEILNDGVMIARESFVSPAHGFIDNDLSYQKISLDRVFTAISGFTFNQIKIAGVWEGMGYFIDDVNFYKGSGSDLVPDPPADGWVTNPKLAFVPSQTIKGRIANGDGHPTDLTVEQVKTMLGQLELGITSDTAFRGDWGYKTYIAVEDAEAFDYENLLLTNLNF